jgi:penicillin amidase
LWARKLNWRKDKLEKGVSKMLQVFLSRRRFNKVKTPTLAVLLVIGIVITGIPLAIRSAGSAIGSAGSAYLTVDDAVIAAPVYYNVTVYRDNWGVPHIYANNTHDAYFALGYVMAQDRLFEMDLFRRAVAGRLAEIFGDLMFKDDVRMRTLGIYQIAVDTWNGVYPDLVIPPEVKENLEMFSAGVNTYILDLTIPDGVPTEYRALSLATGIPLAYFIPYPWTPPDSVAIAGMMGLMLTDTSEDEILRGALMSYNASLAEFLMPTGWINMTTIMPPDPPEGFGNLGSIEAITAPLQRLLGFSGLGGSNNWVVDNLNTTTGNAMLCNDPHLDLQTPGINWQVHINIPGFTNVIGCCIPGGPVIYTGHNDYFAFGVTNLMADISDMYYYVRNATHYWYVDHWEPFVVRNETIYKFTQPVQIRVVSTRHGPLINTTLSYPYDKMAFRWAGKESGYGEIIGFSLMMNATTLADWKHACSYMSVIIQNFVYAGRDGNIAWCPSGKIPVRPPPPPTGTGTMGALPSNGSAGQNEWIIDPSTNRTFWIPHSTSPHTLPPPWNATYSGNVSLPYVENPKQGFIATANNQPIGPGYPGYPWPVWISPACGFDPGYRAQRITELIKSLAPISIDDMKAIQADTLCIPARNIVPILNQSMQGDTNVTIQNAVKLLANWNYKELRNMSAPLIWEIFLENLTYNIFGDQHIGNKSWADLGLYPFPNTIIPLWNMIQNSSSPYAKKLLEGIGETMPQIMNKSLHDALNWIASQLGPPADANFSNWKYGDLHVVDFGHPMGGFLPSFNVPHTGPVGCDGGPYTVNPGGHYHKLIVKEVLYVESGSSYRGIYDCKGGWNTSLIVVPPGESGTVTGSPLSPTFDPHYNDTFQLWLNTQYTTCLFNDTQIQTYPKTVFAPPRAPIETTNVMVSSHGVHVDEAYKTWPVDITVTVHNTAMAPVNGTVNAYYYNATFTQQIGTSYNITNLPARATKTLTFSWNIASVPIGLNFTVKAKAISSGASDELVKGPVSRRPWGMVVPPSHSHTKVSLEDFGKLKLIYSKVYPYLNPPFDVNHPETYYYLNSVVTGKPEHLMPDIDGNGKVTFADVGKLKLIYSGALTEKDC